MKIYSSLAMALFAVVAVCARPATAQTSSQSFTLIAPPSISIVAPSNQVITHDQSDKDQAFPVQSWSVKGNLDNGLNVSFMTSSAFTHTKNPNHKRNAQLGLALESTQGDAQWTVTKASATTDFATGNEKAAVTAVSNGVGRANFNLSVTFVTEEFGLFAAGDYTTTIVGTVSAN
jgi:hypothetical protein